MKSIVLYAGFGLLIINLIAFGILNGFKIYPFITSEISLAISLALLIWLANAKLDDAFKIFIFLAFGIALVVKYIVAHYITESIKDSVPFLTLVGIISTELLLIIILKRISKHG